MQMKIKLFRYENASTDLFVAGWYLLQEKS